MLEFSADGSLTRHWHQNHDGSQWTSIREYDDAGRLLRVLQESIDAAPHFQNYEYDSAGLLARIIVSAANDSERIAETYDYDADGSKKKTHHFDPSLQSPDALFWSGADGTDAFFAAPGAATVTTLHNARGQPTELLFRDQTGRPLSRVAFNYDEAGHLVGEIQTRMADLLPPEFLAQMSPAQLETARSLLGGGAMHPSRRAHRYNLQGQRIETRSSMFGPLGEDVKTMAYNDRGDQIAETSDHRHAEYSIDDEGGLVMRPDSQR